MVNNSDEVAFLSEISALLDTCDPPVRSEVTLQESTVPAGPDNLLLASHQLVAETEELLSSCSGLKTSGGKALQVSGGKTQADRRKIRNANAAKRRLKYCKKVEDERQLLRQQEKELSTELVKLQAAKSETQFIFERTKTMPVWRAIATRQLQSRIVAEAERRRLRDAVATSTKVLQELGVMVQEHLQGAMKQSGGAGDNTLLLEPDDVRLFDRYIQDIESEFNQVDNTLQAWGANDAPLVSFHPDGRLVTDGGVEYYENLDIQLVPFNHQQTGVAMWQAFRLLHQQGGRSHYESVSGPESTIAVKFRVPGTSDSMGLLIRIVLRKRIKAGRTVILWRAHTQGEGDLRGIQAEETGWSVVRPTDTNTRTQVGMPTAILTFIRFIPMADASTSRGIRKIGQFLRLAERSGHESGSEVTRMMESLLLDDSATAHCAFALSASGAASGTRHHH